MSLMGRFCSACSAMLDVWSWCLLVIHAQVPHIVWLCCLIGGASFACQALLFVCSLNWWCLLHISLSSWWWGGGLRRRQPLHIRPPLWLKTLSQKLHPPSDLTDSQRLPHTHTSTSTHPLGPTPPQSAPTVPQTHHHHCRFSPSWASLPP